MTGNRLAVTDTLCRFVSETPFSRLGDASVEAARRALLDGTGVMLAASGLSAEVLPFRALAAAAGAGPCTLLGTGIAAPAAQAALFNGATAHALDFEDTFDEAPCHPHAALLPAAIAMAQLVPVDGREFVAALAVGCELTCRMALSLRRPLEAGGWYPPPILGAFGATAAAARIAGLDPGQTRDALSLTLCQATMPGEIKHSPGTVIRAVREAFPAQAAVTSVLLASGGVPGFEAPLEGEAGFFSLYAGGDYEPDDLVSGLGESFLNRRLSFKRWPACRGTHAYIEMALELRRRAGFDWRAVRNVEVGIGPVQRMLIEPLDRKQRPATAIDAKFSIPFTVALALVRGGVGLDDFSPESLADPELLAAAALVNAAARIDESIGPIGGAMRVHLANGDVLDAEIPIAVGHPARPLSREDLRRKFIDCAARAATRLAPSALADRLLAIDQESNVGEVFALA